MKTYIHAYVDPDLKTLLDMFSRGSGKSQSMCIEEALKVYLKDEIRKIATEMALSDT